MVAPQLNDWGETSARQTIVLVEYFLSHYNIDKGRVYANGCSGGGALFSHLALFWSQVDLFSKICPITGSCYISPRLHIPRICSDKNPWDYVWHPGS